jgi:hypothetical protein
MIALPTISSAQEPTPAVFGPQTLEDYARDLQSSAPGKRTFAARELRRQVRHARRTIDKGRGDPIWVDEARVALADLRLQVAPITAQSMHKYGDVRAACADILGSIGDKRWLPEVRAARAVATTNRQRRHIDAAIELLERR